ncbi:hypothetical protein [Belliella aquatica]|uniref:hypothetical protein n=1 Tax=Belliella aquatica TaxID=1323734 RepID=UPI001669A976|nr:hypothetical protein [Belliella aquatica]MCH7407641.1 hypothetical protein [Belliella aquatica]
MTTVSGDGCGSNVAISICGCRPIDNIAAISCYSCSNAEINAIYSLHIQVSLRGNIGVGRDAISIHRYRSRNIY